MSVLTVEMMQMVVDCASSEKWTSVKTSSIIMQCLCNCLSCLTQNIKMTHKYVIILFVFLFL
jgi:hypothetical protein